VTHFAATNTHYALNLPAGKYDLLVLSDKDKNNSLDQSEVIGRRHLELMPGVNADKVLTGFDINIGKSRKVNWPINIPVPRMHEIPKSLFYPQGTIRKLDDPIFGPDLSTLGMYEPAAFLERAPTMFYTLEEFLPFKVPVIFVHGMGGTVREFIPIIKKLDHERYVPWFFYYPSGSDLNQLAENFYRTFLSGKLFPRTDVPMIIVAHSMGGLVVREALNLHKGTNRENKVALLITIASPFGGHPDAASGVKNAPMVLPAWRDLNPDGQFIDKLFRKRLNPSMQHLLLYAYANPDTFKPQDNSDGVVPLFSQLRPIAQKESSRNYGFNSSHTGILKDNSTIKHIINAIHSVKGFYPESHVRIMQAGGYDIALGDEYDDREKYIIKVLGKYMAALWKGKLEPVNSFQRHVIDVSQGKARASHFVEIAWLKFIKEYPDLIE